MRSDNLPLSLLTAALVGIVQTLVVLPAAWAFIALHMPVLRWLVALDLEPAAVINTAQFLVDPIIHIVLSVPAAYVICLLRPRRLVPYLLLAVTPGIIYDYRLIFTDPTAFRDWVPFVPGLVITTLAIPVATLLTRCVLDQRASK